MSHVFEDIQVMMYEDELPPLLAAAKSLPDNSMIVEYGSGGSTSVFANYLGDTNRLLSVEHDRGWFDTVGERLKDHPNRARVTRVLAPLLFAQELWQFAHPHEETPAGAEHYIWAPETHAKGWDWKFVNLALVDGICRGPCLAYLRTKLSPGTPVFLHDYKGRENWYDWAVNLYERVNLTNMMLELRVP